MPDPSFLLIGAQKCGTTWLSAMLRQHPDVYMPERKELHFFDQKENYAKGMDWYRAHFAAASGERAIGECTPNYLWVQEACPKSIPQIDLRVKHYDHVNDEIPRRVYECFPDLRIVAILRNPVDRAISAFRHHIRMRRIAPRQRILDVGGEHGILTMGFYTDQLLAWKRYVPRERFMVLIYERDVRESPEPTLRRVFSHIGIDPDFKSSQTKRRFNKRASDAFTFARFYSPQLARIAFRVMPVLHRIAVPSVAVSQVERSTLERIYSEEVDRLERHLDFSLDAWREKASDES